MNVEQLLTERIGDAGKRLHTGAFAETIRSRSICVCTSKKEIMADQRADPRLHEALPGRAQDIWTLSCRATRTCSARSRSPSAHYMMAYANMLQRDITRLQDCYERMDDMPLGSGALASTTYPIDRDFVREQLGFAARDRQLPRRRFRPRLTA